MSSALLVVPPFLKHATGPLLGPAMLAGAATEAGHRVDSLDLNARWIERELLGRVWRPTPFVGDHDRDEDLLRAAQERFRADTMRGWSDPAEVSVREARLGLRIEHREVYRAGERVADAHRAWLTEQLSGVERPDVFGVSVLFSGQVLWALAATAVARSIWPGVLIVWGGAHVTALAEEIARDPRYGAAADVFVAGYAEATFVALLDAVGANAPLPPACFRAGAGAAPRALDDARATPCFSDVHLPRGARLTLPAQRSRGCSYGQCTYCTYPRIEGRYRVLDAGPTQRVIAEAALRGANVSFKDSLLPVSLLEELAATIDGRVRWSACTKLSADLTDARLRELADGGCATLEIGVETVVQDAQRLIRKRQPARLLLQLLDAAERAGIALVLNYMRGFPGVDPEAERLGEDWLRSEVAARPGLTQKIERNAFELERLAPMATARTPSLRVTGSWPWSSVLDWEYAQTSATRRLAVVA